MARRAVPSAARAQPCPRMGRGSPEPRWYDHRDLHAPRIGVGIDNGLQLFIQLLTLGKQLVQLRLSQHRPQCRLRHLAGSEEVVLDFHDRLGRIHDPEVHYGVDLHGNVVLGDHVL